MRQLKFRAWDKRKGKMIQPNDGDFVGWHAMSNWKDCLEVMQFTGLYDKNGVEIYEGDLVRVVGDASGEMLVHVDDIAMMPLSTLYAAGEVIGNIHEHSHLLSGGEQ